MSAVMLQVNGVEVSQEIEPRTHLADLLRERLNLTGTHLRCEQGVCGACTILLDGQPARSCITFAAACEGAVVTTIEGLEDDPVIVQLRRAFSIEHGLQCGFCTPGMLVTARDIVLRLPEANEERIRVELSGNLCRCTGYVGIVRAIARVLGERRASQSLPETAEATTRLGPVGARKASARATGPVVSREGAAPKTVEAVAASADTARTPLMQMTPGLGGREPNFQIRQSFTVPHPVARVWELFGDIGRVATCIPGASLTSEPRDGRVEGRFTAKVGPIRAAFNGVAQIEPDDATRTGRILAAGLDASGGSRAACEIAYELHAQSGDEAGERTTVNVVMGALLAGPLAQFGRSGIVEDLVAQITATFATNIAANLNGEATREAQPLEAGSLLTRVLLRRLRSFLQRLLRLGRD